MYSDHQNDWGQQPQDPYYYYNSASGAYPSAGAGQGGPAGGDASGYYGQQPPYGQQQQQGPPGGGGPGGFYNPMNNPAFNNPVLANMAKQYGESLMGQGKEMVDEKLQKFVTVSKLKYYFAVDTAYVFKKIGLILFPFSHKDWTIRLDKNEDNAIQPRNEINVPDLYIPLMAFITFILVAGVCLGMQQRFSPEALGLQASSTMGWLILELLIFLGSTYIINTDLKAFDLMAFCSYKFVIMIPALLACIVFGKAGYYAVLIYGSISLVTFLFRTLKVQIYSVTSHEHVVGGSNKPRLYLLLSLAFMQPLLMWWGTYNLARW